MDHTMKFPSTKSDKGDSIEEIMNAVYHALEEKGYNPINQIVGYLLSGDPAYIPRHNEARVKIKKVERDEILEELLRYYLSIKKRKIER